MPIRASSRAQSVRDAARRFVSASIVVGAPDRPVFVGGCPRSGTTLLRTMLHSHPDLAIPRETRFLVEAFQNRHGFGDLSIESNRLALAEWVARRPDSWFGRLAVDRDLAVKRLTQAPPTLGSVLGTAYEMFAEQHGKARWGDKRPTYLLHHRAIFEMFPDAQFVNVLRDPRSAVASMKRLGWYGGSVAGAAELWARSVSEGIRARRRYRHDQLLEVRYEDLVADPSGTLRRVCAFLTLDAQQVDRMLAFHRNVDEVDAEYHWRLSRPVDPDAANTWQTTLEREEVAFVEHRTAKLMSRYGYTPVFDGGAISEELSRQAVRARRRIEKNVTRREPRYPYPVAARLTTGQRRRHALRRAVLPH